MYEALGRLIWVPLDKINKNRAFQILPCQVYPLGISILNGTVQIAMCPPSWSSPQLCSGAVAQSTEPGEQNLELAVGSGAALG